MKVDTVGEDETVVFEDGGNGNKSEYIPRIQYEDAEYISTVNIAFPEAFYSNKLSAGVGETV